MKLMLLTYEFPPMRGGISRYLYTLTQGLGRQGHQIHVLFPNNEIVGNVAASNVILESSRMASGMRRYFSDAWRLFRAIQSHQPDHVLVTHIFSIEPVWLLSHFYSFSFTLIVYGSDILQFERRRGHCKSYMFQQVLDRATRVICITQYTRRLLQSAFNVDPEKIDIVYPGLEPHWFESSDPSKSLTLRRQRGLNDSTVLLTVARLVPRKGHDKVLEAISQLNHPLLEISYVIVGTGNHEAHLRQKINQLDINSLVHFVGAVPDAELKAYYDMADIYIMPSRAEENVVEGFGISFIEAESRRLPVIGGRHGGVPEAVLDGQTGFLVDPLNTLEIREHLLRLIEQPSLRESFGKAGREFVQSTFSSQKMVENILEVLNK